jgi:hypothetical protein
MALPEPPLIQVHYIYHGYFAECGCGDLHPSYRISLGKCLRYFCERCLLNVLLEGLPVDEQAGS